MDTPQLTPTLWLGAYSPGALILPDAAPTPSQLYAPRGVYFDDDLLIVTDTGNHRVLIWHEWPTADRADANVVLGQPNFYSEGPNANKRGPENGLYLPTGVGVINGKLVVADAWNHRVLVWHTVPQKSDTPPDYALGQPNLQAITENRGQGVSALSLYWPYGFGWVNGRFIITDTGNRRVLIWHGLPEPDQPPDRLLGQDSPHKALENRGIGVAANTFRWPHAVAGTDKMLYIADAGNHRILAWQQPATDRQANLVLGQANFSQAIEWPHGKQGASVLRFPYAIGLDDDTLACADTANNRILFWRGLPCAGEHGRPANGVIGQLNFDDNGENRWQAVAHDTMCWPYGLCLKNGRLAIADSGNNRVMIWEIANG